MKIEKVNDHQIRCTLTREDLADRELKLSELAYGTEKAKDLFRDMMQQAAYEFGFEAEDIPLMIEAIPLNSDCIVLIITKVEDPDELDTRFSKFAPSIHEDSEIVDDVLDSIADGADDVLDLFKRIQNKHGLSKDSHGEDISSEEVSSEDRSSSSFSNTLQQKLNKAGSGEELTRIYVFPELQRIFALARVLDGFYDGSNSLYKTKENAYVLVISKGEHTPGEFNRTCNILTEYGHSMKSLPASEAFLEEHYEAILRGNALQTLAGI